MKILLVSNMYPSKDHPSFGIFVKNFEKGIIENGGNVQKVVIQGRGQSKFEKVFKYIKFFFGVALSVFFKDYDLIYVHYIGHSLLPLVPLRIFSKKKLAINAHGGDVLCVSRVALIIQKVVAPVIRKADLLIVPSSYFQAIAKEKFSIPGEKILISPSGGIDMSLFKPLGTNKQNNLFTIGFVSRIDEGKGWDTLLQAAAELKNLKKVHFKLVIIGGGAEENKLRTMISVLDLQNETEYIGPLPYQDLPIQYNRFDLFAFPTRLAESLGLVGLEAMACGVPVIGSSIGGLKGYIKNGHNGFLFEPGNHQELALKIQKFFKLSGNKRKTFQQNAVDTAKKYDSNNVSEILYKKLFSICASSVESVGRG